jgi:hypothetical protein
MARRKGFSWYFGLSAIILGWPCIILVLALNFLHLEGPVLLRLRDSPAADIYSFAFIATVISTLGWTIAIYFMRRKKRR